MNKKFLIIGPQSAIIYKEIFPLFRSNNIQLGVHMVKSFRMPSGLVQSFGNICWFTNIGRDDIVKPLVLYKRYDEAEYPKYDNYDAIEVSKVSDIPMDYGGVMGVPITFLNRYNLEQFEILGMACGNSAANHFGGSVPYMKHPKDRGGACVLNGRLLYTRLFIKKK